MATAPHVGARIEAVASRPITDRSDRYRLAALLVVAIAIHVWLIANTYVTAKDSIGFVQYAMQLQEPSKLRAVDPAKPKPSVAEVLQTQAHPPGFPVLILIASSIVRQLYDASIQDQMLLSAQIASAFAGILTVFPSYWLGRLLFNKFAGFAAALLYQVLPVAAHETSDGLTEGLYILLLAFSLLLSVRAVKKPGIGGFLSAGLAIGLTYLVRPEGLVIAFAAATAIVALAILRRRSRRLSVAWLTALTVGVVVVAAPYMVLIGGITNKPTPGGVLPSWREQLHKNARLATPDSPAIFAGNYIAERDGSKPLWIVRTLANETLKGFHFGAAIFALIGAAVALRRVRSEPWIALPLTVTAVYVPMLLYLGNRGNYISERHCMPLVFVGLLFAGGAVSMIPGFAARRFGEASPWSGWGVPIGVLAVLVVSCLPSAVKPPHKSRIAHKEAGKFLFREGLPKPGEALYDTNEWASFYANWTTYRRDVNPLDAKVSYAVVETAELNDPFHTPEPQFENVRNIALDGNSKLLYWWPEDVPSDQAKSKAKVLVYRLEK